jgi:hypothetical protein
MPFRGLPQPHRGGEVENIAKFKSDKKFKIIVLKTFPIGGNLKGALGL